MLVDNKEPKKPFRNIIREKQDKILEEALKKYDEEIEQKKRSLPKIEDVAEMAEAVKTHYRRAKGVKDSKFNENILKYELKIQPSKLCKKFVNTFVYEPMKIDGFEYLVTHVNKISKLRQQIFSARTEINKILYLTSKNQLNFFSHMFEYSR